MMFSKVIFFNHHHNGDLHLSRGLVRHTIQVLSGLDPNIEVVYTHSNGPYVLKDINAKYDGNIINTLSQSAGSYIKDNCLYINTWYGADNFIFLNKYGISFDCLFFIFDELFKKHFNLTLHRDFRSLFPIISFDEYRINSSKQWLDDHKNFKKVLVSNAQAKSGQAPNFNFIPAIKSLALSCPKTIFIITNKEPGINFKSHANVVFSPDIIKSSDTDLNENAFLGTFCDIIVGRASSVFTFCFNQKTLFNQDVKMVSFSYETENYAHYLKSDWLGESLRSKIDYKTNITHSSANNGNAACKIIKGLLNGK